MYCLLPSPIPRHKVWKLPSASATTEDTFWTVIHLKAVILVPDLFFSDLEWVLKPHVIGHGLPSRRIATDIAIILYGKYLPWCVNKRITLCKSTTPVLNCQGTPPISVLSIVSYRSWALANGGPCPESLSGFCWYDAQWSINSFIFFPAICSLRNKKSANSNSARDEYGK